MSPEAPFDTSSVTNDSAMRPPMVTTKLARASLRWMEYLSPSGRYIVAPR
jgi:hypothetical protein